MSRLASLFLVVMLLIAVSCSSQSEFMPKPVEPIPIVNSSFVKGADLSWLPQMEVSGYLFLAQDDATKDGLQLLNNRRINTVCLCVGGNSYNHKIDRQCSKEEIIAIAVRGKKWICVL